MGSPDPVSSLIDWLDDYPDHVPARLMLAQAYQRGNDADKAMQQYEILIDKDPDSVLALNNLRLALLRKGDAQKRESALVMAARANELAPDNFDIADTYGWIQFKSGQSEAGVQTLRQALAATSPKRSPGMPTTWRRRCTKTAPPTRRVRRCYRRWRRRVPASRDDAQRLYDWS